MTTAEQYEASSKAYRKGKGNITRAKRKGDHARIIAICDETMAVFNATVWPDNWTHFQRAKDDALFALRRAEW